MQGINRSATTLPLNSSCCHSLFFIFYLHMQCKKLYFSSPNFLHILALILLFFFLAGAGNWNCASSNIIKVFTITFYSLYFRCVLSGNFAKFCSQLCEADAKPVNTLVLNLEISLLILEIVTSFLGLFTPVSSYSIHWQESLQLALASFITQP